jgi:hypothetical protein
MMEKCHELILEIEMISDFELCDFNDINECRGALIRIHDLAMKSKNISEAEHRRRVAAEAIGPERCCMCLIDCGECGYYSEWQQSIIDYDTAVKEAAK